MYRLKKLLWMIFIFCFVFFIICDEKWYKISWSNNHIVFIKIEKESDLVIGKEDKISEGNQETEVIYKNSNIVRIYRGFENPKSMYKGAWIDTWFIALLNQSKFNSWLVTTINDTSISDILSSNSNHVKIEKYNGAQHALQLYKAKILLSDFENWYIESDIAIAEFTWENIDVEIHDNENDITWTNHTYVDDWWEWEWVEWNMIESWSITWNEGIVTIKVENYERDSHIINLRNWIRIEEPLVEVERYSPNNKHILNLKKWVLVEYEFINENDLSIEDGSVPQEPEFWLSDSILENILSNDEIDVKTLESGNDEFLQKVFQETRDTNVMNLVVETYLNEYQFIKAKRFVDNLPQMYRDELKPSLNLRLSFNSFSLSSKTANETLMSLIQTYQSKNMISSEDRNRYLWILSLMDRDYDKFFEIANNFTSENHKSFADKIQWYMTKTSAQMWMPKYYFDTLVALELFNQWFFQPAKVLALSSLQQNSKYILPYQILAYANFLTNSWDTSIEYLKKLVDLDPNNAEKYRFLMGIAYYWNEKYEQSVVMLSMIKDDKLRLDTQRYLINNYIQLNQKNKLILSWNKLLWYENLVSSDFYTYFYETFFHPYSEWNQYEIYAFDTELADKMIRVCTIKLPLEEKVVCRYGNIGKNIALWKFEWLEQSLLDLTSEYPQWYLYHALGEYYIKQWDLNKAKAYLIKAVSMTQKRVEINQIKKLLQSAVL